jgi:hypothetical protein
MRAFVGHGDSGAPTAAVIEQRVATSLARSRNLIVYTVRVQQRAQGLNRGRYPDWIDLTTGQQKALVLSPAGRLQHASLFSNVSPAKSQNQSQNRISGVVTNVDYREQVWTRKTQQHLAMFDSGGKCSVCSRLSDGGYKFIGSTTIDRRPSFLFRQSSFPSTDELWIDRSTYLPLREQDSDSRGTVSSIQYQWLARTTRNRARFTLSVPSAFKYLAPPAFAAAERRR